MYVDGICIINIFIYSWIQSPIFTSFAPQIRRPLCVHHDLFNCIFLNANIWISIKVSLTFICKGPIDNSHIFRHVNITLTSITLVSQITGYSTRLFIQPIVFRQTSTPAFLALCEGNPSVTDGFPSQKASNAASVKPMLVQRWHTTIGVTLCQRNIVERWRATVGPIDKSTLAQRWWADVGPT